MNFVDSLKRWFYTNNSSAAGSAARIPLLDASGNAVGSDTYNAIAQVVRQELATILSGADQGTSGTKFPSIASGVLGSMTAANLASVLGEVGNFVPWLNWTDGVDANALGRGVVYCGENCVNVPANWCQIITLADGREGCQIAVSFQNRLMYYRAGRTDSWKEVGYGIPSFYKDYANMAGLALGVISQQLSVETNNFNIDNFREGVTYTGNIGNLSGTIPSSIINEYNTQGSIMNFGNGSARVLQVCITRLGVGVRFWGGEEWTSWRTVNMV